MSTATQHEVKTAESILMGDVICQSFIQSSSTLAYACLLIRHKKYDLANHVLQSLEGKQTTRFKDMVFYLQAQIGIETGEHQQVKQKLVSHIHRHPNDLVALSLLESSIYLEWIAWQGRQSSAPANSLSAATPVASFSAAASILPVPPSISTPNMSAFELGEGDFGIYQSLVMDDNTQALVLGNQAQNRYKSTSRNPNLASLVNLLPQILPGAIANTCEALDGGDIHKICFSFQNLTVTSLHMGAECLELVTGNINQSLLTMVRAENIFQKQAASAKARANLGPQAVGNLAHE